jgi:outer membrane protein assembly factor BamB
MKTSFVVALCGALAGPALPARADDAPWPQWLGPTRNGVAPGTGVLPKTGEVRLKVAWRRPLGVATSGLAVASDRLITLDSEDGKSSAVALSRADGRVLWRTPLDAGLPDEERGPASTPAVSGTRAFVLSPACQLRALDLATGKVEWHVDLKARFGSAPRLGCVSSPLLDESRVIVQPAVAEDHRVAAFDQRTGELSWSAKGVFRSMYSSAGLAETASGRQVLIHHTDTAEPASPKGGVSAFRSKDGQLLWHTTLDRSWSYSSPIPFAGDRVLLPTWNDVAAIQIPAAGKDAAATLWRSAAFTYYVRPPVYDDGHFYGTGNDFLRCVRATDGSTAWEEKTYPGSVILVDGHLAMLSVTAGLLRLVEATPAGYKERARLKALTPGSRAETPPSVAGRHIFLRNDDEVVAVDVEGS